MQRAKRFQAPIRLAISLGVAIVVSVVLYLNFQSIRNEQLALTQKLQASYKQQIDGHLKAFLSDWAYAASDANNKLSTRSVIKVPPTVLLPTFFVLSLEEDGKPTFRLPGEMPNIALSEMFLAAQIAEYRSQDYREAAHLYGRLAESAMLADRIFFEMSKARNLQKSGDVSAAVASYLSLSKMKEQFMSPPTERNLLVDGWVRGIELAATEELMPADELHVHFDQVLEYLNDYDHNIGAAQRIRLRKSLKDVYNENAKNPSHDGEPIEYFVAAFQDWASLVDGTLVLQNHDFLMIKDSAKKYCILVRLTDFLQAITDMLSLVERDLGFSVQGIRLGSDQYEHFHTATLDPVIPNLTIAFYSKPLERKDIFTRRAIFSVLLVFACVLVLSAIGVYITTHLRKQENLNKLKNDILSTVSHELKTPLTSSQILLENLLRDAKDLPQGVMDYIKILHAENRRQNALVTNFLTYSKIESKKIRIDRESVRLIDLVSDCVGLLTVLPVSESADIQVQIDPDLTVEVDPLLFGTAILNLVENALKYANGKPIVKIKSFSTAKETILSVRDNGIGIASADLNHVFDQFFRSDQKLSRQQEGTGLGLYIVKQIVILHGGSVDVTSTLGEGTTFEIKLPTSYD